MALHNHLEKEIDVSISVAKHKIKEGVRKKNENFMIFKNTDSNNLSITIPTPKFSYQLFITRTYVGEFNVSNTLITTFNFHCDFEQGISNAAKKKHLTNNASESYNSYLNNIFPNKPLFYKLIYILKEEENLSYNDYQRRTKGTRKKKKQNI
ncbi:hypothetical protein U3516DRAFT_772832 [Neocallimastix sp. 'constans']